MTLSVRMDPLLEKELELAAQRQGISKSQFIINAVERALGRKNAYDLMLALQAEEPKSGYDAAAPGDQPYEAASAKVELTRKLKAKHDVGGAG
jgi:RHH-type rel operon transcriptional repressor/antitoxin RelB